MSQAKRHSSIKQLSTLFRDPFVRTAFEAAERDGLAPAMAEVDQPRTLDGGAAEAVLSARILETA